MVIESGVNSTKKNTARTNDCQSHVAQMNCIGFQGWIDVQIHSLYYMARVMRPHVRETAGHHRGIEEAGLNSISRNRW